MSAAPPPESMKADAQVEPEVALADAERRLAEMTAELQATRALLQRERGQRDVWDQERGGLHGDLTEARRRLDTETQAHAQTRGAFDLAESKRSDLQGELTEARRETGRQRERGDRALCDLEDARREMQAEQTRHRTTRERVETLEGGRDRGAQELAAARAQVERLAGEAAVLGVKLTADQTALLLAEARGEALGKELAIASEHVASARRALSEETVAHAATRQRLDAAREAIRSEERKRQRRTIAGVLGGAALGAALMMRRRLIG